MPFKDLYNLDWNTFQSHLLYTSQELHRDKLFADVTLVSEDLIQLKAHKTVLSSASEFFKDLFIKDGCDSSFLILSGVQTKDLQAVIDFIYLGGTKLAEEHIDSFIETAGHLGIKQLQMPQEESLVDNSSKNQEKEEKEGKVKSDISYNIENQYNNLANLQSDQQIPAYNQDIEGVFHEFFSNEESKSSKCEQCSSTFVNNWSLRRHISTVHNKLTFECDKCLRKLSTLDSLKRHKKMLHGGKFLTCHLCDYSTLWPFHLKEHHKNKHSDEEYFKPESEA